MVLSGPERKRLTHQPMREGCGRRKDANTSCFFQGRSRRTRHLCLKSLTADVAVQQAKNRGYGSFHRLSEVVVLSDFGAAYVRKSSDAHQRAKPVPGAGPL